MSEKEFCVWCGRPASETDKLVPGPRTMICGRCVKKVSGDMQAEEASLAEKTRREVEQEVAHSFKHIIQNLNLGPLQEKYQRLMRVKFKEETGSPSFNEVFLEFKKGVEAELPSEDFENRYDLAIAYHEMGLDEDAFREMLQSLKGALRQGEYDRAGEIISALLYFHGDSARALRGVYRMMAEAGFENQEEEGGGQ